MNADTGEWRETPIIPNNMTMRIVGSGVTPISASDAIEAELVEYPTPLMLLFIAGRYPSVGEPICGWQGLLTLEHAAAMAAQMFAAVDALGLGDMFTKVYERSLAEAIAHIPPDGATDVPPTS